MIKKYMTFHSPVFSFVIRSFEVWVLGLDVTAMFLYCIFVLLSRYTLVRSCAKPYGVKLSRNTNEELKTHTKSYLPVSIVF